MSKYPDLFGTDYEANKAHLNEVALVHSKMLRNKIAGYITKMKGRAAEEQEEQEEREKAAGVEAEAGAEKQAE